MLSSPSSDHTPIKNSIRFLSESTGLPVERVEEECDRENFLTPAQAMELGIIDGVIAPSA